MWLYFLEPKTYPILRGPDYVIKLSLAQNLSILRGPDYVIISSS